MIGTEEAKPSSSWRIGSGSGNGPLRMIPAIRGNVPEESARRAASSTSVRSAGITTTASSVRRGRTFTIDMPATTIDSATAVRRSSSPLSSVPSTADTMPRMDGATSARSSGSAQTGVPAGTTARTASTMASSPSGSALFTATANSSARSSASSGSARAAIWPTAAASRAVVVPSCSACRCWSRPLSTSRTGAPRFAAIRALKPSSAGLATSV